MNNPEPSLRIPGTLSHFENLEDNHNQEDLDISSKFLPCIKVFQKSSSDRGHLDLMTIIDTLKCFKFLQNSSENVVRSDRTFIELAKIIKYQYIEAQKTIFHKGDTEDRIYLILHGTVVIFSEVTGEVFKVNVASVEEAKEDKVIEKTSNNTSKNKILIRSMTGDEQTQKALFQPKMNRKLCRQQTSIGDINSPATFASTVSIPTVHELKKALHNDHSGTMTVENNIPHHLHSQNRTNNQNNESPESPTWAQREAKKKLVLYKLLFKADKEKPGKYIKDGKFLFEMKKKLSSGLHFGDTVSKSSKIKDTTAIALEGLHVLSFSMEEYVKLFNHHPENPHNNLRFLEPFFPDASYPKLLKLMNLFEECEYWQRQIIFEENSPVDAMYFIKEGEAQLLKGLDLSKYHQKEDKSLSPKNTRKKCYLATLGKGEMLGEDDIFFGEEIRHYSAVVTSGKLVVLKINADVYNKINEVYKELFIPIRKAAKAKRNFHNEQIKKISQQVVNSVQQTEDFKLKSKQVQPHYKLKEVKLPKEFSPSVSYPEDKSSPTRIKSRLDSPNKSKFGSPKNVTSQKTLLTFDRRESGILSNEGSPTSKEKRFPREITDSPLNQIKSTNALSTLINLDKRDMEPLILPKPVLSKQERTQTPVSNENKPSSSKLLKPKRVIDFNSPLADKFSSLYKRALGNVRRKKLDTNLVPQKTKLSSSIGENQALYDQAELQRSIQNILYKTKRASVSPDVGYISLEGSPVAKNSAENRPGFILESLLNRGTLEKMNSPKKALHSSASIDQIRVKEKAVKYNSKTTKRAGIDLNISQLSPERPNSSCFLSRIHSPNYPRNVNGSKTPNYVAVHVSNSFNKKKKDEEQDSEEELSTMEPKNTSHVKLNQLLSKLEVDEVDPNLNRIGWKPSKTKSVKVKYRYYANKTDKGEKVVA